MKSAPKSSPDKELVKVFEAAKQQVTEYADNTNYKDEFLEMNQLLREINESLKD